jgi:hypothetical protein
MRIDIHIVKDGRGWHVESSRGASLGVFDRLLEAYAGARDRARELQRVGLASRILLHRSGRARQILEFPILRN